MLDTKRRGDIEACFMAATIQHRQTKRGLPKTTHIHTLLEDSGFASIGELRTAIIDQSDWGGRIYVVPASA